MKVRKSKAPLRKNPPNPTWLKDGTAAKGPRRTAAEVKYDKDYAAFLAAQERWYKIERLTHDLVVVTFSGVSTTTWKLPVRAAGAAYLVLVSACRSLATVMVDKNGDLVGCPPRPKAPERP